MQEILLVDKPAGMSSFGVVARVRQVLSKRAGQKIKVGHTGTLDPFATGLLILVIGKGTRRAGEFVKLDKIYEATVRLGASSSTGDPEGEVTKSGADAVSEKQVRETISQFIGKIEQVPPVFSAIKIRGERAYRLARRGIKPTMPTRTVQIHSIEILSYQWPDLHLRVHVSSGTYVRSLAKDIGEKLGVGGYLVKLRRTQVGEWHVGDAKGLESI
jgi:tRNA pseudouridine55 synthase